MDGGFIVPEQPEHSPRSTSGAWLTRHLRFGVDLHNPLFGPNQSGVSARGEVARSDQPWLAAALDELRECPAEAREEGYPEPTADAMAIAETILKQIAKLPHRLPEPSVYPSADREIVLFFCRTDAKSAVSLSVDADGGGACFSNVGGQRRARYDCVAELPDAFVQSELRKLSRVAG